jgi:hypothetical protein
LPPTISASPQVDEKALIETGLTLQKEVTALAIKDQNGYNAAALERAKIKQHIDFLEGIFGEAKKKANAAVTELRNLEKKTVGPRLTFVNTLLTSLNASMSTWLISEERRVREEKAEADRLEAKRVADEKAKLLKQAAKAEEKGKDTRAEALKEQAASVSFVPAPVKQAVSFAGTGTSARDDVSYVITDTRLFLRYLLDSGAEMEYLVDFKVKGVKDYIKNHIAKDEDGEQKSPGITITQKKTIAG